MELESCGGNPPGGPPLGCRAIWWPFLMDEDTPKAVMAVTAILAAFLAGKRSGFSCGLAVLKATETGLTAEVKVNLNY